MHDPDGTDRDGDTADGRGVAPRGHEDGRPADETAPDRLDDDPLDTAQHRAPPHPLDRVWMHPSEFGLAPGPPTTAGGAALPPGPRSDRSGWWAPVSAGAAGAIVTLVALAAVGALGARSTPEEIEAAVAVPVSAPSLGEAAAAVSPSVVSVRVLGVGGAREGSGVCVRRGGEVLTNAALLDGAERVVVIDAAGQEHVAEVLGRDRSSSLALLRVEVHLDVAELADEQLDPGENVLVVGADHDRTGAPWMSGGIVASIEARLGVPDGTAMTGLVETDAVAGNRAAGGALVRGDGTVAGVLLDPVAGRGAYAVPIDEATRIAAALRRGGAVPRGWLGVRGSDVPGGVGVVEVVAGGPAARAGIAPGDVVTAVANQAVTTIHDLRAEILARAPGDRLVVSLTRQSTRHDLAVVLADHEEPDEQDGDALPVALDPGG